MATTLGTIEEKPVVKRSFSSWLKAYKVEITSVQEKLIKSQHTAIERNEEQIKVLKERSDASSEVIQVHISNYQKSNRQSREKQAKAANILNRMDLDEKKLLKKLKAHSMIQSITVGSDGYLSVFTKMLKWKTTNIGKFRICLSAGSGLRLYVFNLTYSQENRLDHWAIQHNEPCLGEYTDIVWDNIYRGEIYLFIDSMIHFITMAGDDGAYTDRDDWFDERTKLTADQAKKKSGVSERLLRSPRRIMMSMNPISSEESSFQLAYDAYDAYMQRTRSSVLIEETDL